MLSNGRLKLHLNRTNNRRPRSIRSRYNLNHPLPSMDGSDRPNTYVAGTLKLNFNFFLSHTPLMACDGRSSNTHALISFPISVKLKRIYPYKSFTNPVKPRPSTSDPTAPIYPRSIHASRPVRRLTSYPYAESAVWGSNFCPLTLTCTVNRRQPTHTDSSLRKHVLQ